MNDCSKNFKGLELQHLPSCGSGAIFIRHVSGHLVAKMNLISIVPQCSILGPLLFAIYLNDLPNAVSSSWIGSYVDDTKLCLSFASSVAQISHIFGDLYQTAEWCCYNKLLINTKKTQYILIGPKNNYKLSAKPYHNLLGVYY